jgi:hypothetical protein
MVCGTAAERTIDVAEFRLHLGREVAVSCPHQEAGQAQRFINAMREDSTTACQPGVTETS